MKIHYNKVVVVQLKKMGVAEPLPCVAYWLQRYAYYLKTDAVLSSSEKVSVEPFNILL